MVDREPFDEKSSGELAEFERALGSLVPRPARLGRGRLLFLAGRASAGIVPTTGPGSRRWGWPALSTALGATTAVLAVMLAIGPEPEVVRTVENVHIDSPGEGPSAEATDPYLPQRPFFRLVESSELLPTQYLSMRRTVLSEGVDALPSSSATLRNRPMTSREILRSLSAEEGGT